MIKTTRRNKYITALENKFPDLTPNASIIQLSMYFKTRLPDNLQEAQKFLYHLYIN